MTTAPPPDPRAPHDRERIEAGLAERRCGPVDLRLVGSTGSTNADAVALLAAGATVPLVVAAEVQTAGRGRLDRTWMSPQGASLLTSVAVLPSVPVTSWGWLPLIAGVAVSRVVTDLAEFPVGLKWPNDVMCGTAGERKLGGILAERTPRGEAVIGIGLNLDLRHDERPIDSATSLWRDGAAPVARDDLLAALVATLLAVIELWVSAGGDAERCGLAADYRERCVTLGREVRVEQPGGHAVSGVATAISSSGALVLATPNGSYPVSAGDVHHLRPI